eukprot:TRINITY_DN6884_c0_g2_i2.p2 TRINITY_DN6884_c0_g2~~TRINITY_DN6884_c0_g2_i2.p2  ORF type:complete len:170 (-),score=33.41 TRINITY_DN6884_c0_g2_i2:11-520(-)
MCIRDRYQRRVHGDKTGYVYKLIGDISWILPFRKPEDLDFKFIHVILLAVLMALLSLLVVATIFWQQYTDLETKKLSVILKERSSRVAQPAEKTAASEKSTTTATEKSTSESNKKKQAHCLCTPDLFVQLLLVYVSMCNFKTSQRKETCLLYTSPSPRDGLLSRMPSSA